MRLIVLGIAACLAGASVAHGQGMTLHVQKIGKQVITEIELVKPPPLIQGKEGELLKPPLNDQGKWVGGATATAEVLNTRNWRCAGTVFDDDQGRRWRLTSGLPIRDQPRQLSGWRLVPTEGEPRFFTVNGRLFTRQ